MRRKDNVNTELETWTRSIVANRLPRSEVGDDEHAFLWEFSRGQGYYKRCKKKLALLLYCSRQDVQDIFVTLNDPGSAPEEEIECESIEITGYRFSRQVNVTFERH